MDDGIFEIQECGLHNCYRNMDVRDLEDGWVYYKLMSVSRWWVKISTVLVWILICTSSGFIDVFYFHLYILHIMLYAGEWVSYRADGMGELLLGRFLY